MPAKIRETGPSKHDASECFYLSAFPLTAGLGLGQAMSLATQPHLTLQFEDVPKLQTSRDQQSRRMKNEASQQSHEKALCRSSESLSKHIHGHTSSS